MADEKLPTISDSSLDSLLNKKSKKKKKEETPSATWEISKTPPASVWPFPAKTYEELLQENKKTPNGYFTDYKPLEKCPHQEHEPPSHLFIPRDKQYHHQCPKCGLKTVVQPFSTYYLDSNGTAIFR